MAKHKTRTCRAEPQAAKRGRGPRDPVPRGRKKGPRAEAAYWLYGLHAVSAALANPRRRCQRLVLAEDKAAALNPRVEAALAARRANGGEGRPEVVLCPRADLAALLPPGAVHQGLALQAQPLAPPDLKAMVRPPEPVPGGRREVILALDQVTDPQNVGAVLRTAAVFGARALLVPRRHAPPESGTLAKVASGALERVPYLPVTNLARTLAALKAERFWCLGLCESGAETLDSVALDQRLVLVLGAEGAGLRRLTEESCDLTARLPLAGSFTTLNVASTAAVALYEVLLRR